MKNLSALYSQSQIELLDLITFHEQVLVQGKNAGRPDPAYHVKMQELAELRILIDQRVELGLRQLDEKQKVQKESTAVRSTAHCPECDKETFVNITGEGTDPDNGFTCDRVVCSVCGEEFLNDIPNNWEDRIASFDNLLVVLQTLQQNEEKFAEDPFIKEMEKELNEKITELKNSHAACIRSLEDLQAAAERTDKCLASAYHHLLASRIAILDNNSPSATLLS